MNRANTINITVGFLLILLLLLSASTTNAQKLTQIRGKVIDAKTKEPLPFVNIVFVGKNIGTTTDYYGKYNINTQWASNKITASFIGYKKQTKTVILEKNQVIDFELGSNSVNLDEVVIVSKKKRYKNKNNPAVELIKRIIKNKNLNRKEHLNYYQYNKYEKVEFDINNITEKFRKKKVFKKFQFIFNYVDTAEINGKPYLPVFLKETLSDVYFRKKPKSEKEYIKGIKMIGFHDYIDNEGVGFMIDHMYQDIDIYANSITLLTNQFTSPISNLAPVMYKFHIIDTVNVKGFNCINLAFQPRNRQDFAFVGNLYVTNNDRLAVIKVDMRVAEDINLNFVTDLQIIQEFGYINNQSWMLVRDEVIVDYNIGKTGTGMYGKKTVFYDNYVFNQKVADTVFNGIEKKVQLANHNNKDEQFWEDNRITGLSEQEENIYTMVDSVQNVPAFKRTMDVIMLLVAGYWNFNKIDIGPVNTFYSFNDIEGFRLRVGGRTSENFSKTFRLDGFLVYGFKDQKFKYSARATMSLNKRPLKESPRHTIMAMYQRETNFPGMEMMFINEDNFFLSFKRGVADKILYYDMFKVEHYKDWGNDISTTFTLKHTIEEAGGNWSFNYDDYTMENITSSEIITKIRFAPNETFYQGMDYKTPVISKHPIFQITYTQGLKDVLNSDFQYPKLKFNFFKRFYLSPVGFTNFEVEAGKVFAEGIPYTSLFIHRANQTYSYQLRSYNLMNFLEFVSDEYAALFIEHHFNGFVLNKIPLLKRLKWRSIISYKGVYGNLSDKNNPETTPGLMLFPTDANGNPTTFTLNDKPYMEASVGVGNIFKFFRIDIVKRLTYLDNPNVQEYGIRARFKFEF
ncbi:MAG: hypothetical protein B6D64_10130 [Bacteroidetes bacterium 4484_276]|nr:MAG: hypothetical protein B6D64_10130 [Bacteroidetes bacterium 4484_276]OQX97031.1 MAG: hypothetical protein B6I20_13535 [Bacteroidetes bacterium 4572_117]